MAWIDINYHVSYSPVDYNDNRAISATTFPVQQQSVPGTERDQIDNAGTGVRRLRFVKAATTVAAGNVVGFSDADRTTVTTTVANYISRNDPAGVAIGTITAGNYGWILCKGKATVTLKAAVVAVKGDSIILSDTTLVVDQVTAGTASTYKPLGIAQANGSGAGGTVVVYVDC